MDPKTIDATRAALIRQGAYADAAKLGLLAAGLGAAIRGGTGLYQMAQKNMRPAARPAATAPVMIDVPIRKKQEEDNPLKMASQSEVSVPESWVQDFLSGGANTKPSRWWAALPVSVAAGAGGLYGGWKLSDMLMDSRRKSQLQAELDDAKSDYEAALRGESKLGQALDALYDRMEKEANIADIVGPNLGLAALLGLTGALGSGYVSYNLTKARNPQALKDKAKRQYQVEQYRRRPSPILARPVPLAPSSNAAPPSEDELEGEPLDKTAGGPEVMQALQQDWPAYATMAGLGTIGGLGLNELMHMTNRVMGYDTDPEQRKVNRRLSAATGLGVGLAGPARELLSKYFKQPKTVTAGLLMSGATPPPPPPAKPPAAPKPTVPSPSKPRPR